MARAAAAMIAASPLRPAHSDAVLRGRLSASLQSIFMLARKAKPASLAVVSRNWATLLDSGVPVKKATQLAGRKAADPRLRRAMGGVADDVAKGTQLAEALDEAHVFPDLFVDLVATAEQAGAVPEVLRSLADHYDRTVNLRREFRSQILPSMLQLLAAVGIIALLIFILGIIADSKQGTPIDVTGLGLYGGTGSLIFLAIMATAALAAFVGYKLLTSTLPAAKLFHSVLLAIPVVGGCMRNFALARFSWAFALTQNAGLPIQPSLEASLRATSNGAFIGETDPIVGRVMAGEPLSDALESTGLFPPDFIEMVDVGETSGTVPETLARISPDLEANAQRSLKTLATTLGYGVWLAVAAFIAYIVIRLFYVLIIAPTQEALEMTM